MRALVPVTLMVVAGAGCGSSWHSVTPTPKPVTASSIAAAPTAGCTSGAGTGSQGGHETASAGDIPDTQAYVSFAPASGNYMMKVPAGWAQTASGPSVTFTDKLNTIRVEVVGAPTAPTSASAQANELPGIQARSSCPSGVRISTVTRSGGQAVLVSYQANSAQDPVTGKVYRDDVERYEFWKSGREAIVTLSAPVGSDNVDPWRTVTNSFAWTR